MHQRPMDARIQDVLRRVGLALHLPVDSTELDLGDVSTSERNEDELGLLFAGARQVGIFIKETKLNSAEVHSLMLEGYPVILHTEDNSLWVFENAVGKRVEASCIGESVTFSLLGRRQLKTLLQPAAGNRFFVAKKELECDSLSASRSSSTHHADHSHPAPFRRFLSLLRLDARDVWTVSLFALVSGILALATPLAIESLVNVVSWGTYIQPLLVLALMLLACLGLAGVLRLLQTVVVEIIQRRQLVRIVGDLSHRFPRADRHALAGSYPRELANRVFDIMTIQKATAVLLLDGLSIVLTTVMGLLLLAFYHPFLLGFDLVLLLSMVSMTWLLGRGGVNTAIEESICKYRIAHWLQDVLAMPTAFKVNGGELLAIERANRLTAEYIAARQRQFRVVLRQNMFAIGLQVVASTALLGLGGWLVMRQQLTLGQLVASELVVTVVVGAFAKAGKSLEKFYDLMAGIDKIGHLLDIPVDPRYELGDLPDRPVEVRWEDLAFEDSSSGTEFHVPSARIPAGARVAIVGNDRSCQSMLIKCLAGLLRPHSGLAEVGGLDAQRAALAGQGQLVGYASGAEIFHGSLQENVDLGRSGIGQNRVREVLAQVGLWDTVLRLPQGLRTALQTDGAPLSITQRVQLTIARSIAAGPKLLLLDGVLDHLTPVTREKLWEALTKPNVPWTLILVTNHSQIAEMCDMQIDVGTLQAVSKSEPVSSEQF